MDQQKKVAGLMNQFCFFFYIMWMCVRIMCACAFLPGKHLAPECTMWSMQAGRSCVMLWAMETLGQKTQSISAGALQVEVMIMWMLLWHVAAAPCIVADSVHPFTEMAFPYGFGLFQQDNALYHKAKGLRSTTRSLRCWLDSRFPRS